MGRNLGQDDELRRTADLAVSALGSLSESSVVVSDRELRCVRMEGGLPRSEFDRLTPYCRAALAGERRRFERRPADGSRVYDIDVARIEEDGETVGGLAVGRDVTQRKQTERALARSAREYRDLAEQGVTSSRARTSAPSIPTSRPCACACTASTGASSSASSASSCCSCGGTAHGLGAVRRPGPLQGGQRHAGPSGRRRAARARRRHPHRPAARGDEFAVLLPMTGVDGAACIVEALDREFRERPAVIEGREVTARPSIGVAALELELDVAAALRRADQAMSAVKRAR